MHIFETCVISSCHYKVVIDRVMCVLCTVKFCRLHVILHNEVKRDFSVWTNKQSSMIQAVFSLCLISQSFTFTLLLKVWSEIWLHTFTTHAAIFFSVPMGRLPLIGVSVGLTDCVDFRGAAHIVSLSSSEKVLTSNSSLSLSLMIKRFCA